ncbi:MAG: prepilin-type N-terminal cleavage/methylation domain-containing protein [Magnetococcales bacterium]|nr:prepilin-type N-terminal cleavage/methylation domain-containing protein [Magnetococcales bacterium]
MTRRLRSRGFTLLEVMITLFLITILTGLVIPYLGPGKLDGLRASANRFRQVLIWLRDQGASGLAEYRLRLEPAQGWYHVEVLDQENFVPVADPLLKPGLLHPADGQLRWQPDQADLSDPSEVTVGFTRFGPERAIQVQFTTRDGKEGFTVSYRPEWSQPRLEAGLLSWK